MRHKQFWKYHLKADKLWQEFLITVSGGSSWVSETILHIFYCLIFLMSFAINAVKSCMSCLPRRTSKFPRWRVSSLIRLLNALSVITLWWGSIKLTNQEIVVVHLSQALPPHHYHFDTKLIIPLGVICTRNLAVLLCL